MIELKPYNGNPLLKQVGERIEFSLEQIQEITKCRDDPFYFIENYCKIVTLDEGLVLFKLYEVQKEYIRRVLNNRKTVVMQPRQTGKTTTAAGLFVWLTLFNERYTVAILANKGAAAKEVLDRYQTMYENLPRWMQVGVTTWNKGDIELENGSKVFTAATSSSGIRGRTVNFLYVDEAGLIPNNVADQFFASVYPVISSGTTTKIFLTSTPLGYNHFWKIWTEAENGKNGFVPYRVNYWDIPGRDEKWAEEQRKTLGELKFNQEVLCLGGNSTVTVRNRETGEVSLMTLETLYDLVNTKYEILTPSGFQPFDGIIRREDHGMTITTTLGSFECSFTHRFIVGDYEIEAQWLRAGDVLIDGVTVLSVEYCGVIPLYDPVNVGGGHQYISEGLVHHNCAFLGSSNTLIPGDVIAQLATEDPIYQDERAHLQIYKNPEEKRQYVAVVDVSRGIGGDYSAITVIDVTDTPYALVAKYKCNTIAPMLLPDVVLKLAKDYNDAFVLVEVNDIGAQISDILYTDLEYENLFTTTTENNKTYVTAGFNKTATMGVRTTKSVKRIGCFAIKNLIEEKKLLVTDVDVIFEMSTFIEKAGSFQADEGYHDDLMMTLVLFGWLTTNTYFKDLTNVDVRRRMYEQQMAQIQDDLTPFGFIVTAEEEEIEVNDGVVWSNSPTGLPEGWTAW